MLSRALLAVDAFGCAVATGWFHSIALQLFLLTIVLLGRSTDASYLFLTAKSTRCRCTAETLSFRHFASGLDRRWIVTGTVSNFHSVRHCRYFDVHVYAMMEVLNKRLSSFPEAWGFDGVGLTSRTEQRTIRLVHSHVISLV